MRLAQLNDGQIRTSATLLPKGIVAPAVRRVISSGCACTFLSAAAIALPGASGAQVLELPAAAIQSASFAEPLSSYRLPIGPFADDTVQSIWAEGEISRQAWQIPTEGLTTLQLLSPLRAQLADDGFDILFECEANSCGGFDFRYATDVLPEPQMHVDLGDYRFLSAQRMGETAPEYISFMISRSSLRGFIQITHVGPELEIGATQFTASTKSPDQDVAAAALLSAPLNEQLQLAGRAILGDLTFATGSSNLGSEQFASLDFLAEYLTSHPDTTVALVGHTDAEGGLGNNMALSKKRAASVMKRLIDDYSIPASQLSAEGVGFLAPVASNQTDDGRTLNRRVEVIITSTQ